MPAISVERTIGKTKRAVLGGLIRYNTEKMGKQKYRRFAISLRDDEAIGRRNCRRGLDDGAVHPVLLDRGAVSRPGPRDHADRKDRGGGQAVRGGAILSRHDERSGSRLLPGVRV